MSTKPRRTSVLLALGALLLLVIGLGATASAIPGGGASPNTPGTSSSIPTPSVPVGGTIRFQVGGFPAGETLFIKIDDEKFCASPPFGACVYHQQKIGANGSVSGSFTLPAGLAPGPHHLRFLASEQTDAGLKGFTRKSPGFTVTAASMGSGSTGSGSTGSGSGSSSGGQVGAGTTTGATGAVTPGAQDTTTGTLAAGPREAPAQGAEGAAPAAEPQATLVAAPSAAPVESADMTSVPWIGLYVLIGCLLVSSMTTTVVVLRRR
ncbi:hypothetical protein ASE01_08965 [Nocardioides sp. Root190]|uniref:hypothetical protein n=1 Tax=Nocardioides sp. Root190 TaxID=1736488 RepID=UPI0006F90D6A|nr:hypothetical protein [Nocardioides sp. Root190]KRB76890.1 hypothetical protein ASE01_08965 [Nocardioides sp. Root190]